MNKPTRQQKPASSGSRCLSRGHHYANRLRATAAVLLTLLLECSAQAPPGVPFGNNALTSLRYAAAATADQAVMAQKSADSWSRAARSSHYRADQFPIDFRTLELQLITLRERFNWMATIVLELKRPYARNALAELDAGLNLIGEPLVFLDQQFRAGVLDQATLIRTCGTLEVIIREWELELKRRGARMGVPF
jgi:hypothetical protein